MFNLQFEPSFREGAIIKHSNTSIWWRNSHLLPTLVEREEKNCYAVGIPKSIYMIGWTSALNFEYEFKESHPINYSK